MKQIFDQFLHFLQQGIAAIFKFVQLIWTWSIDQISRMMQAPWENWPLWKQILLVIVVVAVAYTVFIAARPLWFAGVRVLAAFAGFLGALVVTLPMILLAGCIALGGLWVINNFNPASLPTLTVFERSNSESSGDRASRPSRETTGQGAGDTTGSRQ
jgi:hypothetical protein